MLRAQEYDELVLNHALVPCGPIPTIGDPDGIYPYESYCETAQRPHLTKLRFVAIENDYIRVVVCPDLGGKVHSIFHKRAQNEILFQPRSIRPARILPRMAFISGGIEVSFPVSHTPVQLETVSYSVKHTAERLYIWCGEREIRHGMQWTVEYSLGASDAFLTQRTSFYNPTSQEHPWTSWSNAAFMADADTVFHFPNGEVLYHGAQLRKLDWAEEGPKTLNQIDRMAGFFWINPECNAFGVYSQIRGSGLYHVADAASVPGIKLWVYGNGDHQSWAHLTNMEKASYVEIQAGPVIDQSVTAMLSAGEQHVHIEFWIPTDEPLDVYRISVPQVELIQANQIPMFNWVTRSKTDVWLKLNDAYQQLNPDRLPAPPEWFYNQWPPSGMEELGQAIAWALSQSEVEVKASWQYYLAVWLAARGDMTAAMSVLSETDSDSARVFEARLLRCFYDSPQDAVKSLLRIQCDAVALHPQVVIERDLALSCLGTSSLDTRKAWLDRVGALNDDELTERVALYLLEAGRPSDAKALLEAYDFEPIHQRYMRTELWNRALTSQNMQQTVPRGLGEDDLAQYGSYRTYQ